jgi:membrane-associated phospholipid phosphatase
MLRVFLALILFCNVSRAENFFEAAAKDITSPLQPEPRHYLDLGLATSALMWVFFKDDLILGVAKETNEHKPLGDYALYGDYGGQLVPNALYAGGMYATYLFTDDPEYKHFASQMFRASLYAGLFTNVLKNVVSETRPNGAGHQSFPSGHTTTAFAFATVVAMNHEWYWGVPAYAFAAFVGYSRINDNKHFLHDVTVGATVGTVYGLGIYYLDKKQAEKKLANEGKKSAMFITPMLLPKGGGFFLVKSF